MLSISGESIDFEQICSRINNNLRSIDSPDIDNVIISSPEMSLEYA